LSQRKAIIHFDEGFLITSILLVAAALAINNCTKDIQAVLDLVW